MGLKNTNLREYSLEVIGFIKPILEELRHIAKEYTDAIEEIDTKSKLISFNEISRYSDFHFFIDTPDNITTNDQFQLEISPGDEKDSQPRIAVVEKSHITDWFKSWISLILSYKKEEQELSREEKFQRKYEQEFIAEFKILDEDADLETFDDEKQLKIYYFLSYVENAISTIPNPNELLKTLKQDIAEFKEEIPVLTKSEVVKKGSKLFAIFKKLGQTFKNKIIDKLIEYGMNKIADGSAIRFIENFHHHLP